jgi:hypothetical protein
MTFWRMSGIDIEEGDAVHMMSKFCLEKVSHPTNHPIQTPQCVPAPTMLKDDTSAPSAPTYQLICMHIQDIIRYEEFVINFLALPTGLQPGIHAMLLSTSS